MRRREFMASLGVVAPLFIWPRVALAQRAQVQRMRRVGVLKYTERAIRPQRLERRRSRRSWRGSARSFSKCQRRSGGDRSGGTCSGARR